MPSLLAYAIFAILYLFVMGIVGAVVGKFIKRGGLK